MPPPGRGPEAAGTDTVQVTGNLETCMGGRSPRVTSAASSWAESNVATAGVVLGAAGGLVVSGTSEVGEVVSGLVDVEPPRDAATSATNAPTTTMRRRWRRPVPEPTRPPRCAVLPIGVSLGRECSIGTGQPVQVSIIWPRASRSSVVTVRPHVAFTDTQVVA